MAEEVLRAQAVAARTFALSNMNKFIDKGYNICATTNSHMVVFIMNIRYK